MESSLYQLKQYNQHINYGGTRLGAVVGLATSMAFVDPFCNYIFRTWNARLGNYQTIVSYYVRSEPL